MTAIYGLIGDFNRDQLNAVGRRLSHRGAYVREWSPSPGVWLGQRSGDESHSSGPQSATCAAHAGIYNRNELAERLGADPELSAASLLQELITQHGLPGLSNVNGDYVLALWDADRERLLLARSPLGARVLYYWQSRAGLAFASEYKGFYSFESFEPTVDRQALQQLQASWYLPPGKTLLQGVRILDAGVALSVGSGGAEQERFWSVRPNPSPAGAVGVEAEFRSRFVDAVRRRSSDLEVVGAELSGGIDSAAIVAVLRQLYPERPIKTFTIGAGPSDPEILAARLVAETFSTEHFETYFQAEQLPEVLPEVVWHLEDPIARTETVLYYELMRVASEHVGVVLGGYASDGLYAGMPKHKLVRLIQRLPIVDTGLEEFYHYTQTSRQPSSLLGRALLRAYYGPSERPQTRVLGARLTSEPLSLKYQKVGLLDRVLQDSVLTGVPNWMPKVEKPHSAFDVDVRIPYTDIDLVAYSFGLPENLKMRRLQDKYILRKALGPLLPDAIAQRPKYPQRMEYDLALSRVLDDMAERYLSAEAVRARGLLAVDDVEALRRRPTGEPYSPNRSMRLWTAVATEIWATIFLDARGKSPSGRSPIAAPGHPANSGS